MVDATPKKATLKDVREYFGMKLPEMKSEWVPMSQEDKDQILTGLGDGTETY